MDPKKLKEAEDAKRAEEDAAREAELEERIGKAIDARLNRAISSHITRLTPKLADTIGQQVLAGLQKAREDAGDEGDGAGGDPGDATGRTDGKAAGKGKGAADVALPPEVEKRIRALEKVTKDAEKRAQEAETRAKEMEERRRVDEENDLSTKTLLGLGIKDEVQLESALLFHRGKGRIKRDEDGRPVFVRKDKDGAEETVPLDVGLKDWGKTEEAKRFLPASNAAGSGSQGGRGGGGTGGKGKQGYSDTDFATDIFGAFTIGGGTPQQ